MLETVASIGIAAALALPASAGLAQTGTSSSDSATGSGQTIPTQSLTAFDRDRNPFNESKQRARPRPSPCGAFTTAVRQHGGARSAAGPSGRDLRVHCVSQGSEVRRLVPTPPDRTRRGAGIASRHDAHSELRSRALANVLTAPARNGRARPSPIGEVVQRQNVFERRVALDVMRAGHDVSAVLSEFRREPASRLRLTSAGLPVGSSPTISTPP